MKEGGVSCNWILMRAKVDMTWTIFMKICNYRRIKNDPQKRHFYVSNKVF